MRFFDLKVSVNGDTARAEGTVKATGAETMRIQDDRCAFVACLEKTEGRWLVSRVEVSPKD